MKPRRNRIYCLGCMRSKMLFESQAKADNFIVFNSSKILSNSSKAPLRSYYCSFCSGWHVTSVISKSAAEQAEIRDAEKWESIHIPRDGSPVGRSTDDDLQQIDILLSQWKSAILGGDLVKACALFDELSKRIRFVQQLTVALKLDVKPIAKRIIKANALVDALKAKQTTGEQSSQ